MEVFPSFDEHLDQVGTLRQVYDYICERLALCRTTLKKIEQAPLQLSSENKAMLLSYGVNIDQLDTDNFRAEFGGIITKVLQPHCESYPQDKPLLNSAIDLYQNYERLVVLEQELDKTCELLFQSLPLGIS